MISKVMEYISEGFYQKKDAEIVRAFEDLDELKTAVNVYSNLYNTERFHQSLDYETPDDYYYKAFALVKLIS